MKCAVLPPPLLVRTAVACKGWVHTFCIAQERSQQQFVPQNVDSKSPMRNVLQAPRYLEAAIDVIRLDVAFPLKRYPEKLLIHFWKSTELYGRL